MTETLGEKRNRLWDAVKDCSDVEKATILHFLFGYMETDTKFLEGVERAMRIDCPERLKL